MPVNRNPITITMPQYQVEGLIIRQKKAIAHFESAMVKETNLNQREKMGRTLAIHREILRNYETCLTAQGKPEGTQ